MGPMPKSALVLTLCAIGACKNPPKPIVTTVNPRVHTYAKSIGFIDPSGNCGTATPAAPPAPSPPAGVARGMVGFLLWRNTFSNCQTGRHDIYRTVWEYDLSNLANLKGLVTDATMNFSVFILPASVGTHPQCRVMTGGGERLERIQAAYTTPPGVFTSLAIAAPFPSGSAIFTMPPVWSAGQVTPQVSTLAGGGNRASFTVNVKDLISNSVNLARPNIAFVLVGSLDAQMNNSPTTNDDCRTTYQISPLSITHY